MKYLITTIAAVLVVGCATTQSSEPQKLNTTNDSHILKHVHGGEDIIKVKQAIADGHDIHGTINGITALWAAAF